MVRILNTSVSFFTNANLYLGTSLINFVSLGRYDWGLGVLPLRFGTYQKIIADELTTEPFLEYNYYPSSFYHVGNRINLRIAEILNISFLLGYVSGNTEEPMGNQLVRNFGAPREFQGMYYGFMFSLFDKIFFPEELYYNKLQYEE